jgi:hypothetical protein
LGNHRLELTEELRAKLGSLMEGAGFARAETAARVDGRRLDIWVRQNEWKEESVILVHRLSAPKDVTVNLELKIRLPSGKKLDADGQGLAVLAGHGRSWYDLPSLSASFVPFIRRRIID